MSDSDKVNASLGIYGGFTQETGLDAGIDRFEHMQEPDFAWVDEITKFIKARIIEAELEPRGEVLAMYDEPAGAMAHRYAKKVRADMVTFRRIVLLHCVHGDLHDAVRAIAGRWSDHHEFRDEWRLT